MNGVVVLNASYEPLHQVSFKHAVRMLFREVAVVEEVAQQPLVPEEVAQQPSRRARNLRPVGLGSLRNALLP